MKKLLFVLIPVLLLLAFPLFVTVQRVMEERSQEPALPADIATWEKREACFVSGSKILVYTNFDKKNGGSFGVLHTTESWGIFLAKVDGRLVSEQTGSTQKLFPDKTWIRWADGAIETHTVQNMEEYTAVEKKISAAIESHGVFLNDLKPCTSI